MNLNITSILIFALVATVFDAIITSGWFLSGVMLAMGIYWLIKACKSKNNYRYKIKACMGISTFIVTTFVGYTISWAVERDFTKFAYSVGVNYPQNKSELILKANFNWYTTMALMSYGNTDKYVIAQLKMFPYQIAEYDFKERQFHLRAYD